ADRLRLAYLPPELLSTRLTKGMIRIRLNFRFLSNILLSVDSYSRERTLRDMDKNSEKHFSRRKFLGVTLAGGATVFAGRSHMLIAANSSSAAPNASAGGSFKVGGDLPVNRLGFGAM